MQIQRFKNPVIYLLLILLSFSSCMVETVKEPKNQTVTIYSDCLKKKDLKLFKSFSKKEHILVNIIYLPTKKILYKLKKASYNTDADIIILKSTYDMYKAQKGDLLQPLNSEKAKEIIDIKYRSKTKTWFGIGIDPYVFVAKNDSVNKLTEFSELLKKSNIDKWSTNFEKTTDIVPMISALLQKKKRIELRDWYQEFINNQHFQYNTENKKKIPLITADVLLTNYSTYIQMVQKKNTFNRKFKMTFSNQKKIGAFYNLHCIGIVKQARNYENAKLLLEYIITPNINEKLNNCWNTFPIQLHSKKHAFNYQNTYFKLYKGMISKNTYNYSTLGNIVKKTSRKEVIQEEPLINE
jgi:ABC-type Fe3+ transport system substrate-binding protein